MGYTEHRSTARVLSILQLAAGNRDGYTLSKLAELTGAPKGSIFPILQTLKAQHFLLLDEKTGLYRIGPAAFQVGMSYVNREDSLKYVEEKITEIVEQCRETVHFAILDKGNVVYLLKKDSPQAIRMISMVGKTLPAYGTGIGKALLMDYSLEELKTIYPVGLKKLTGNTITEFDTLYEQLNGYRKDDIAYECEESNMDVQCVAVAIRKEAKIIAALSVAIPVFRCNDKKLEDIRNNLLITKKELEDYFAHTDFTLR
jgi:DNA-binding IclR family transcriptional regulator